MDILFAIFALVIGAAIGFLVARNKTVQTLAALAAERDMLRNSLQQLKKDALNQQQMLSQQHDKQTTALKEEHDKQLAQLREQHHEQMEKQAQLIREQINSASEEILKKRAEELNANNTLQMDRILNPLKEKLQLMKEAVEKSDREQSQTMARLDQSIKENLKQASLVGERADKLAEALTGENKTQGNFGELRLRTILEQMGLEEGTQFEEQLTLRDDEGNTIVEEENGKRMVPDVVLHFPDNRDVVIDSKMSLKAFEDYYNCDDEAGRSEALQRHILSVRNHVKELAKKNYSKYVGPGRLDFVLMYVYSESALQLALANDPSLWKDAYDQGVIISGSQSLYVILRVLEMSWHQVKQAENQEKIMALADSIIDRTQLFYTRLLAVEEIFNKGAKAFTELKSITAPSGRSITTAASSLVKLGAKENPKRKNRLPKPAEEEGE